MIRLEQKNHNTPEVYNRSLLAHYKESGLDYSDLWRISALLKKFKGGKLLDIGCGICPLAVIASKRINNAEIYAIDLADELIDQLIQKYPEIKYSVADFNRKLPFGDNSFDYVVLGEIIEHSEDPRHLIKEALRVLKQNGIVAISVPLGENRKNHQMAQHVWGLSEKDIKALFDQNKIIAQRKVGNTFICHLKK